MVDKKEKRRLKVASSLCLTEHKPMKVPLSRSNGGDEQNDLNDYR